ncbi:MAG: hypothetical protein COY40_04260 [Alphaproteobacteria bacterium CG_4_10_14_0_8_um_filter_53_9]|nr:MAG: hypothetical protein COY40_04260 [Alphaproteobacteria bacterium CG_4_10_14_0_8_um_filter_53_9]
MSVDDLDLATAQVPEGALKMVVMVGERDLTVFVPEEDFEELKADCAELEDEGLIRFMSSVKESLQTMPEPPEGLDEDSEDEAPEDFQTAMDDFVSDCMILSALQDIHGSSVLEGTVIDSIELIRDVQ